MLYSYSPRILVRVDLRMLDNIMLNVSLEHVAEYIQRDSVTWEGVSLFYAEPLSREGKNALVNPPATELTSGNSDELVFMDHKGRYIILGAQNAPKRDNGVLYNCLWIENMGSEWELVCRTLRKIATPCAQVSKKFPPYSILVVEDEPLLKKMMVHYLKQFGTVIATSNYRQATANYMVQSPHLVFLDINYHGDTRNGFDVLESLLNYDSNAFIVMVSGDSSAGTKLQALALGAQGFIGKPFRDSDFSHYLTRLEIGM